jgi:hypothetical protein
MSNSDSDSVPVTNPTSIEGAEPEAEQSSTAEPQTSFAQITFQGNSYDLASVVGVTIGAVTLLACVTCNMGYYCLPIIAIVLGIIGLVSAKDSVDPERTRLLSWLSLGSGAVIVLLILLVMVAYIGIIIFAVATEGNGF